MNYKGVEINVNNHSSICLNGDIYIDPYKISQKSKSAKLIFITHPHFDHLDFDSIKNILSKDTIFVATDDSKSELLKYGIKNEIKTVKPNEEFLVLGIKCKTFPAYNLNKKFHPRKNNWIGYQIKLNNITFTICGDSDLTSELKAIKTDVLFLPIGGTFTMDAKEAATLAKIISPKLVIPVHYGEIAGGKQAEEDFLLNLDKNINVKILLSL